MNHDICSCETIFIIHSLLLTFMHAYHMFQQSSSDQTRRTCSIVMLSTCYLVSFVYVSLLRIDLHEFNNTSHVVSIDKKGQFLNLNSVVLYTVRQSGDNTDLVVYHINLPILLWLIVKVSLKIQSWHLVGYTLLW